MGSAKLRITVDGEVAKELEAFAVCCGLSLQDLCAHGLGLAVLHARAELRGHRMVVQDGEGSPLVAAIFPAPEDQG